MSRPTLFLAIGLPGCGKTTAARQFETEHAALRLTKDEWMKALYGAENPSSASDVIIEGRLITIALRALTLGVSVALDFGLWSRDERSALRYAGDQAGASLMMWFAPITPDEQRRRQNVRLSVDPHSTWPMSDEELLAGAAAFNVPTPGELDGTEPIDAPPPDRINRALAPLVDPMRVRACGGGPIVRWRHGHVVPAA
jgi:predicted kinase